MDLVLIDENKRILTDVNKRVSLTTTTTTLIPYECDCNDTNYILVDSGTTGIYPTYLAGNSTDLFIGQRITISGDLVNINQKFAPIVGNPDFNVTLKVYSGAWYQNDTDYPTTGDLLATSNTYHSSIFDNDVFCFAFNNEYISGTTTYVFELSDIVTNGSTDYIGLYINDVNPLGEPNSITYWSVAESMWYQGSYYSRLSGNICYII